MPKVDTTQTQWQDVADGGAIDASRWNAKKDDLVTLMNGGLDEDNVSTAGLHPDNTDGTAVTLNDGAKSGNSGEQTIARDTKFTGSKTDAGTVIADATTISGSDTTPDVTDIAVLYIDNTTGSTATITRFDNPVEGQVLKVYCFGANDVTLTCVATGSIATNGEIVNDTAGTDLTYAAADEFLFVQLRATDLNSDYGNLVWVVENTRTAT